MTASAFAPVRDPQTVATGSGGGMPDTFPKLLLEHARVRPNRPANREKDYGIWQSWSWAGVAAEVEALACGLAASGLRRGDKLAIIGDNRPRPYWTIAATQALGGVPVPIYQDSIAEEIAFVLDDAEVRFAVAEDQEQVDKLAEIKERCPLLEKGDLLRSARHAALRPALARRLREGAGARPRIRPHGAGVSPR
jgi:long-chain acyl-CoA synthetase